MRSNRLENNTKVCSIGAIQARIRNTEKSNQNEMKWNVIHFYFHINQIAN